MAFSDYTGLVGRGIGTVIGAYFGGPMGAQIGGAAGQMEGDKFGGVLKGKTDWTAMLTPGPAQEASQEPAQLGPLGQQALTQTQTDYNDMNKSLQGGGKTWRDILRLVEGSQSASPYSIMGNQSPLSSIMGSTGIESPAMFNGFNLGLGGQPGNVSGDPMGSNIFLPNSDIQQLNPGTTEFSLPSNVSPPSSYSPNFAAAGPAAQPETAPTSTPQGFNWDNLGKALVGMGHVLSATGAGLNGDPNYIMRLQAQVNQAARDKSQAAQEQSKIDQQQQLIKLEKLKGLKGFIDLAQTVADNNQLSDEQKKNFGPQLGKMAFENTNVNMSPEFWTSLTSGKGKAQQLADAYPDLAEHLTPQKALALVDKINKNPGQEEQIINSSIYQASIEMAQAGKEIPDSFGAHLNDKQQKNLGDMAFNQIMGVVNQMTPESRAAVTNQQIMSLPNGKYITDEHYTRLKEVFPNVEAASVLKSQAESAPGRQQSESHFQQSKAMEESHFQQNKAQQERHHQESMANQAQQTETTKPVSEAELKGAAAIVSSVIGSAGYKSAESDAAKNKIVNDALKGQRLRLIPGTTAEDIHNKWFGLGSVNPAALPVEYIPYVGKGQGIPVTGKPGTPSAPAGGLTDKLKQFLNTPAPKK